MKRIRKPGISYQSVQTIEQSSDLGSRFVTVPVGKMSTLTPRILNSFSVEQLPSLL